MESINDLKHLFEIQLLIENERYLNKIYIFEPAERTLCCNVCLIYLNLFESCCLFADIECAKSYAKMAETAKTLASQQVS